MKLSSLFSDLEGQNEGGEDIIEGRTCCLPFLW